MYSNCVKSTQSVGGAFQGNNNIGAAVVKPRPGEEPTTRMASKVEREARMASKVEREARTDELLERAAHAQRLEDARRLNQEFNTLAERIAHTSVHIRSVTVECLVDAFPGRFMNWSVSQCFFHANGGPLYVDYCYFEYDVEQCRRKAAVMRAHKLRYVWLEKDDTFESAERKLKGELK
jgi:hypothetical protein